MPAKFNEVREPVEVVKLVPKTVSMVWQHETLSRSIYADKERFIVTTGSQFPNAAGLRYPPQISQNAYGIYCKPKDLREIAFALINFCNRLEDEEDNPNGIQN